MKLLRNPEMKKKISIYIIFSLIVTLLGFFINAISGFLSLFTCMIFILISLRADYIRYENIKSISQGIDKVLHGQDEIYVDDFVEGELSILKNEISKMTIRLREQTGLLKKDKVHLTDSIADISHQIKTPLTSMNLLISLLEGEDISRKRRFEIIKELEMLTLRIDWLISSLLKLSKIDAKTAHFKKEKVVIKELLETALEPMAVHMDLKGQEIEINIQGDASFIGDILWSNEAIGNIIKNSMEHTPDGGKIIITASENAIYSEILIKDNGKGIAKEDLPHLFDRFYKGKYSSKHSVGIGLALAKRIINEQNGTIKVENNIDVGAVFTIRFYKEIK